MPSSGFDWKPLMSGPTSPHIQVFTPVIPNTGQRSDVPLNSYYFWMINISNISLVFQNGPPQLLSSNVTAIVDSGTGTIKGPTKAIQTILNAFQVSESMKISHMHAPSVLKP